VISCIESPTTTADTDNDDNNDDGEQDPKDNPIYELQPQNGKPFESILTLRAAKLQNHQSVTTWDNVKGLITVRYDHLQEEFESSPLRQIEEQTGWT
jgi:hypothetical protein